MLQQDTAQILLGAADRRTAARYSIALPVDFFAKDGFFGIGSTVDISKTGVRFTTDAPLPVGAQVSVAINWPAPAGGQEVKLRMSGVIVRSNANEVAAQIVRSDFHRGFRLPLRLVK